MQILLLCKILWKSSQFTCKKTTKDLNFGFSTKFFLLFMFLGAESWWTWTTTLSSTTPTKTLSSSASRTAPTPSRSFWRRSDGSPSDLNACRRNFWWADGLYFKPLNPLIPTLHLPLWSIFYFLCRMIKKKQKKKRTFLWIDRRNAGLHAHVLRFYWIFLLYKLFV